MRALHAVAITVGLLTVGAGSALVTAAPKSSAAITIALPDLNCTTALGGDAFEAGSWSWGAEGVYAIGGGGGGAGKSILSALTVSRLTDGCSPALFGAVMQGKHFKTLTLTQLDANGVVSSTVQVEDVVVTGFKLGGTTVAAAQESLEFTPAGRFRFTDAATGAAFCWEVAANKRC